MQPQRRIGFITALLVLAGWAVQAPPVQAATATFGAADDASVFESSPTGNFGFASTVESDGSPRSQALLRFEIGTFSEPVRSATLRLYVTGSSSNGPEVWPTSAAWDEGSVTWADRPSRQGSSALADLASVSSGRWVDLPVTSHVAVAVGAGTEAVSFVLVADSSDGFDVRSAEASSNPPELVVETGEEPPPPPPPSGDAFDFGAIGDTGYSSSQVARLSDLRKDMNGSGLEFTVHDGDFKSGTSSCGSDSLYTDMRDRFDRWTMPFIYTPGDNEWSDCSSPLDRLDFLREVFFPTSQSLGDPSMTLERQSSDFPENARWDRGGVTFATVHTVGSDNNADHPSEYWPRNEANLDWISETFDEAVARGSAAVVLATQANPNFPGGKTGFYDMVELLEDETVAWGKPVLFIHGDTHSFQINQPLRRDGATVRNFTRLETYATSDPHWVRVMVDPASSGVFSFKTENY